MPVHDLNEFIRLSASLNFQLCASEVSWEDILDNVLEGKPLRPADTELMLAALAYAARAYSGRHRKLGPFYVLHPLRVTALLASVSANLQAMTLLTAILHDKMEDITAESCESRWDDLEREFNEILDRLAPEARTSLIEGILHLTRRPEMGETYNTYIARLMAGALDNQALVEVKLADRLDNTLDMRIDVRDPVGWGEFYARVFELLFVRGCPTYEPGIHHPRTSRMNGADRLYELFKNMITLCLIRQQPGLVLGPSAASLFEAVCLSSIREAQRIIMHIFAHHLHDVSEQRRLMVSTMDYCIEGGIDSITRSGLVHPLDGFLMDVFDHPDPKVRVEKRRLLYTDKGRMVMGACAFIVIFLRFQHQPDYFLRGVRPEGLRAQP